MKERRPKAGDRVRVQEYMMGHLTGFEEFELCEHHYCLGVFTNKLAGRFVPLCDMLEPAPDSERKYISNFGEYDTKMIATYQIIQQD